VIIFRLIRFLSKKKITKLKFKKKKTETGSNRPVSVRFFRTKTGSNWFDLVLSVWLGFFRFGSIFVFGLGLVPFGSVFLVLGL
jgi:hypothetical protein